MIDIDLLNEMDNDDFLKLDFGDRLKIIRKKKGLTLEQLEKKSGISRATIAAYETGRNGPGILNLELLCKSLDVKSSVLLGF